ncbi:hypothetical protein [Halarcobacter anaerophilus]|nr:hypothetical protein [Halarcobacter anaerophilus]
MSCHGTASFLPKSYNMVTPFYPVESIKNGIWTMYEPGSKIWNQWFQNRWGNIPQSEEKDVIALDYSTFLEQVLMNYAADYSHDNNLKNYSIFEKWRKFKRESRSH